MHVQIPDPTTIKVNRIQAPPFIRRAFELDLGNGQIIKFCDFSSAGNTWSKESLFNTWCLLLFDEYDLKFASGVLAVISALLFFSNCRTKNLSK
jgi:hypothetical protein